MQAVILSAGFGSRLGALTQDCPKALVRVAGRELMLRVKDFLDQPSVTERIIVTGCQSQMIDNFIRQKWPEAKCVHNPDFTDGSIRSIETALPLVNDDMLIMNVDHIYPRRMFPRIVQRSDNITAICDFDRALGEDDMKVKLNSAGALARISKQLDDLDCGYIGMTFVPKSALQDYRNAVAGVRRDDGNSQSVEHALGRLATCGQCVNICDVSGFGWFEVDTQNDLAVAERALNSNPDLLI
jgi:choline kinase